MAKAVGVCGVDKGYWGPPVLHFSHEGKLWSRGSLLAPILATLRDGAMQINVSYNFLCSHLQSLCYTGLLQLLIYTLELSQSYFHS